MKDTDVTILEKKDTSKTKTDVTVEVSPPPNGNSKAVATEKDSQRF